MQAGVAVTSFSDPDEFQKAVQPAQCHVVVTGRGKFEAELTQIKSADLWMQRGRFSLPAIVHSSVPADRRMFFLQFDPDQAPILHSGKEIAANEIVCYRLRSEHHYRTSAAYRCGGMSLTQDKFAAYEKALLGRAEPAPAVTRVVRPQPASMARLLDVHKAATDLAATAPDMFMHPEVQKAFEQELVRATIACLADPATEERDYSSGQRRAAIIARFAEILEMEAHAPLYLSDICSRIGISERTLRLHCQEHLGMNPQKYLWLRRMNMARRALTRADLAQSSVTAIAVDHGFGELGRFSVQYRELFAESPSETLRRVPDEPRLIAMSPAEGIRFPILP